MYFGKHLAGISTGILWYIAHVTFLKCSTTFLHLPFDFNTYFPPCNFRTRLTGYCRSFRISLHRVSFSYSFWLLYLKSKDLFHYIELNLVSNKNRIKRTKIKQLKDHNWGLSSFCIGLHINVLNIVTNKLLEIDICT